MGDFINVFVSYANEDRQMWKELEKYLVPFKRQGLITLWEPSTMHVSGGEWDHQLRSHLESCQLILLLISPDYIASDYLYHIEMAKAMERHVRGQARVLPILLHPVYWQGEPFGKLPVLPENQRPISQWRKQRLAFLQISLRIREVIQYIQVDFV